MVSVINDTDALVNITNFPRKGTLKTAALKMKIERSLQQSLLNAAQRVARKFTDDLDITALPSPSTTRYFAQSVGQLCLGRHSGD